LVGLQPIDEILVMEQGCVVERGSHDDLVATGGRYAELWGREATTD